MNDGDWICGDANCGNINFARRVSCYRCNKERPDGAKPFKKKLGTEIGKSAAEKSRGLFNADDWQCNKCANVNWARRHTCNVCNAPKFGEVEARTGYGGGYNERGVVEYRRREPSSDDEYDEFGRKKRKRKHEPQDKVGITEGEAFKKLPATMMQKEKLDVIPGPAPKVMHANNAREKISGSLSDGSVCELPPLSKMAFRRHQLQTQTHYSRQDHMLPGYRNSLQQRNFQQRKRFSSTGDRDQTGSSGYETASKKSRHESSNSPVKMYDPVMENRVSSTNNDFVYKFTGQTPTEDFQVTYTLEERVRAAAFALVYSNCKITTEKFEWLYDKPAPDFKTIFGWRQRLLSTGCLIDSHVDRKELMKQPLNLPPVLNENVQKIDAAKKQTVTRIPNPDEIAIISDSEDDENSKDNQIQSKLSSQRSVSAETLLISVNDRDTRRAGSSISTGERRSQARSQSESSNVRSRSSSRDSQDSNYPDTDSEKHRKLINSKTSVTNKKTSLPSRVSVQDSESDSISYNSDDDNFLSRVYGEGRKFKRKLKKRTVPVPAAKPPSYAAKEDHSFLGYSTAKPSIEQSPLVTGNIYTSNLRNMNVRHHENVIDIDGCSSEYIPTKLGSTTKNYQEFKNNVRRKGYWAKGNGTTFGNSVHISNEPITRSVNNRPKSIYSPSLQNANPSHFHNIQNNPKVHNTASNETILNTANTSIKNVQNVANIQNVNNAGIQTIQKPITQNVYIANEINNKSTNNSLEEMFTPINPIMPLNNQPNTNKPSNEGNNSFINNRTLNVNRSIGFSPQNMDIDDQYLYTNENAQSTPNVKVDKILENTSRIFDVVQSNNTSKNRSILDIFMNEDQVHESPERTNDLEKYEGVHKKFESTWDEDDDALYKDDSMDEASDKPTETPLCAQSPISNMLYARDDDQSTPKKLTTEIIQGKQEMLLGLLKDLPTVNEKDPVEEPVQQPSTLKLTELIPLPAELSNEIINISQEQLNGPPEVIPEVIKPSKQINILESITIKPCDNDYRHCLPIPNNESDTSQEITQPEETLDQNKINDVSQDIQNTEIELSAPPPLPVLDLSNLLSGINTNTLLLALQNLQQINQGVTNQKSINNEQESLEKHGQNEEAEHMQTINLTNDEEWERESNRDGSIERELKKLDGDTGDTPFLSDIFDPGPVVMPSNIARKLNINLKSVEDNKEANKLHLNENAPVIGNFKSFALPKPIILNRLKLTVKPPERPKRSSSGKKNKRKKKSKASASQGEEDGEEDEEEESGDEADLSKYDLWGSDEEKGNSSRAENADKSNEGESSKEGQEKNGKVSPKKSSKRSRSSSTSSSSSSSSSSSHSSTQAPKNKFDDFNLNSERETSPKGRKSRSRSRSPRAKSASAPTRRKSRDSRSAGESRSHEKEWSRDRERRDRSRGNRDERKERRYSREGGGNHYGNHGGRGRHR